MHYYSSNVLLSCYIMCPSDYDSTDYANHSNMILQNDDYFVDFKVVDNQTTEFIIQQHEMQQCIVI